MAVEISTTNPSLLDLPDLALLHICSSMTCPFDLLHFGNTCTRLRKISSATSLWWTMAFRWLKGLWILMEEGSIEVSSRDWMLDIMRQYCTKPTSTKSECHFSDYQETWRRVDSPKFRFLFHLMRVAYARDRDDSPAVLYEQWLYDIGVYHRSGGANVDYTAPNLEFSPDVILQLSSLGQASERDLCRRKQPYKDAKYYVKRVGIARGSWMDELFPVGHHGSICPLLICPLYDSFHHEVSGIQGVAMCVSVVFERRLRTHSKASSLPLYKVWEGIKVVCTVFVSEIFTVLGTFQSQFKDLGLKAILLTLIVENLHDFNQLKLVFERMGVNFTVKDILQDLYHLFEKYREIDFLVDDVRLFLRKAINKEIENVLFPSKSAVTRINLTDSDLIGGDNSKHEMSSAAFVTDHGVLVTWHLTGRMRY